MGKTEKLKELFCAFCGGSTPAPVKTEPQLPLKEMVRKLESFDEEDWGLYAFNREPLSGKFSAGQKRQYIRKANDCGKEWAERIAEEYHTRRPGEIAAKMGIRVETPAVPVGGELVLFAQFVQPDEITIFTDCLDKASSMEKESGCQMLNRERLFKILLAHELFHAVEERHEQEIYTRTEKVELWRKPFSNKSSIACLSEIAAMAFAAQLLGLTVSPYMLDVLLVRAYDRNMAAGLFEEICRLTEEKMRGQQ